jgi:hypothetical protein
VLKMPSSHRSRSASSRPRRRGCVRRRRRTGRRTARARRRGRRSARTSRATARCALPPALSRRERSATGLSLSVRPRTRTARVLNCVRAPMRLPRPPPGPAGTRRAERPTNLGVSEGSPRSDAALVMRYRGDGALTVPPLEGPSGRGAPARRGGGQGGRRAEEGGGGRGGRGAGREGALPRDARQPRGVNRGDEVHNPYLS